MEKVVILSAVRTAVGSFGGSLKNTSAVSLGSIAIKEALERSGVDNKQIDEVIYGCVLQSGLGQNVARQCSIGSGLGVEVPAMTINKVCGSGLRTVSLGAATIMTGDNKLVVVGGTENMSQAPYVLDQARFGYKMGNATMKDTMVVDGLWDVYNDYHMGITAENIAEKHQITREEQDVFAALSQQKAEKAQIAGKFKNEIVSVELKDRKGNVTNFDQDEYIRYGSEASQLSKLKPAFKKDGTVTAGMPQASMIVE